MSKTATIILFTIAALLTPARSEYVFEKSEPCVQCEPFDRSFNYPPPMSRETAAQEFCRKLIAGPKGERRLILSLFRKVDYNPQDERSKQHAHAHVYNANLLRFLSTPAETEWKGYAFCAHVAEQNAVYIYENRHWSDFEPSSKLVELLNKRRMTRKPVPGILEPEMPVGTEWYSQTVRSLFAQAVDQLRLLHSKGIFHGNVSPSTVVANRQFNQVRLINLQNCRNMDTQNGPLLATGDRQVYSSVYFSPQLLIKPPEGYDENICNYHPNLNPNFARDYFGLALTFAPLFLTEHDLNEGLDSTNCPFEWAAKRAANILSATSYIFPIEALSGHDHYKNALRWLITSPGQRSAEVIYGILKNWASKELSQSGSIINMMQDEKNYKNLPANKHIFNQCAQKTASEFKDVQLREDQLENTEYDELREVYGELLQDNERLMNEQRKMEKLVRSYEVLINNHASSESSSNNILDKLKIIADAHAGLQSRSKSTYRRLSSSHVSQGNQRLI